MAQVNVNVPPKPQVVQIQVPGIQGPPGVQGVPGQASVLSIGTITTGAAGTSAAATISGVAPNQFLNLTLPTGATGATGPTGPANTLTIGTVTTLSSGSSATATITGPAPNQTLSLGIPMGPAVADATTTSKGQVQLAGDLAGTAAAPTVTVGTHHTHTSSQISDAASAATVSKVIVRDINGRAQVVDPSVAADISTKNYVDTQVATKANNTVTISAGTGLTGGGDLTANRTLTVAYGSIAGTAVQGNDARVTADQAAATASIRTIGTGALQAAAGNHTHTSTGITDAASAATASVIMKRDINGRAQVVDPSVAADIATKNYVDTADALRVQIAGDLGGTPTAPTVTGGTHHTHTSSQISDAVSAATASKVVVRDANGRAQVVDPSVAADIATKNYVDTRPGVSAATSGALGTIQLAGDIGGSATAPTVVSGTNHTHTSAQVSDATSVATASKVLIRDANGRASVADPSVSTDIATKNYTDTQVATKAAIAGDLGGTAASPQVTGGTHHTHTQTQVSNSGVALTDAATIATDASTGRLFRVTITASRTLGVPTNPADGMRVMWEVTASGTGPWTLTMASGAGGFKFGTDFTSIPAISTGTTTYIGCLYSSRDSFWHVLAVGSGH